VYELDQIENNQAQLDLYRAQLDKLYTNSYVFSHKFNNKLQEIVKISKLAEGIGHSG